MRGEHVVVVRLTALGDAILAEPFLRALRDQRPDARLTFVTGEAQAPLFRDLAQLDRVVGWSRARHRGGAGLRRLAEEIRRDGPVSLYVDLQNKVRTVALGRLLKPAATRRWRRRSFPQALAALLGRDRILGAPHATRRYFAALGPDAAPPGEGPLTPRLPVPSVETGDGWARGRPVALAPAARWATKRWAPERLARVGRSLAAAGHPIVLVAGPGDEAEADAFLAAYGRPVDLDARDLGLEALASVLARCAVLVAPDTGPGHLAAAVGTPVVSLFGPTPPERWAPAHPRGRVVGLPLACRPCSNHGDDRCPLSHHRCMVDLTAEAVLAEVDALLAEDVAAGEVG